MPDILIRPFSPDASSSDYVVEVPGSKSITNRALLLAALADGKSVLSGVQFSDDSRHFLSCLRSLGFRLEIDEAKRQVAVCGEGGRIPNRTAAIDVGSAGTAARFLTAFLGISEGEYQITASEQMKKRPMRELFDSLARLGASFTFDGEEGFLPVTFHNRTPLSASRLTVNIDKSSQFLSALLISACLFTDDVAIELSGTHGMAYIDMTVAMMEQFGIRVERPQPTVFFLRKGQSYRARAYQIEPDVSAACYFYAMAPLLGISMTVSGIPERPLQGDIRFLSLLEQMGCTVSASASGMRVTGPRSGYFSGVCADLGAYSDQALTLAAIAPFAESPTTMTGIGHIRFQECDRLNAIRTELGRLGILCEALADGVVILPGTPKPAAIETYHDHRVAMAFSLVGLRTPGIIIKDALCCAKTFEHFFDVLNVLYR